MISGRPPAPVPVSEQLRRAAMLPPPKKKRPKRGRPARKRAIKAISALFRSLGYNSRDIIEGFGIIIVVIAGFLYSPILALALVGIGVMFAANFSGGSTPEDTEEEE